MLLLRPKQRFEVVETEARAYFSSDELERAATFRVDRVRQYASDGYVATREALATRP